MIFRTLTSYISFADISSLVRAAIIIIFSVKGFTVISNAVSIEKKMKKIFDFFYDLLHLGPLPLLKKNGSPRVPPLSFYIENREKIGFPMLTAKNGFQILNLHPQCPQKT